MHLVLLLQAPSRVLAINKSPRGLNSEFTVAYMLTVSAFGMSLQASQSSLSMLLKIKDLSLLILGLVQKKNTFLMEKSSHPTFRLYKHLFAQAYFIRKFTSPNQFLFSINPFVKNEQSLCISTSRFLKIGNRQKSTKLIYR